MAESSFRFSGASSSTSLSLLSRVRAAEPAAWERLARLYGPVIYRWARQAGLQPQDASDVVQDVFHSVTTNIGKFREQANGGGFRGWLWTITRNKIRDHYRNVKGKVQGAGGTAALDLIQQLPEKPPLANSESGSIEISNLHRRAGAGAGRLRGADLASFLARGGRGRHARGCGGGFGHVRLGGL